MSGKTAAFKLTLIAWFLLQMKDLNVKSHSLIAAESAITLTVPIVNILKCAGEPPNLVIFLGKLLTFLVSFKNLFEIVLNHIFVLIKVEIIAVIISLLGIL